MLCHSRSVSFSERQLKLCLSFSEGETVMTRNAKLKIAALATAVLTTFGSVAATTGAVAVDAGKNDKNTGGSWCC